MDHREGPLVTDCRFTDTQWINGLGREPGLPDQRFFPLNVHNPWSCILALWGHSVQFHKCVLSVSLYHNSMPWDEKFSLVYTATLEIWYSKSMIVILNQTLD